MLWFSPSPSRPLPLPTGLEQCTFSPAVNRMPRSLSHAVADYLEDPAHLRLSRQPPPSPSQAPPGRGLTRSASFGSAPLRGSVAGAKGPPSSPGGGASEKADEVFASFLERQAAHLHRKRMAEQQRAETIAKERDEMLRGVRRASDGPGLPPPPPMAGSERDLDNLDNLGKLGSEGAEMRRHQGSTTDARHDASKSFLERVAEQTENHDDL